MERGEGEKNGSAFTSGPLLLRIIDHYHLCDLEWDKRETVASFRKTGQGLFLVKLSIKS